MKNINSINIDKFKSIFVSINFLTHISAESMSKDALLACVIKKSNKVYKTEKEMNRKLAEMYNASADISVEKYRDYINFKVTFEYINIDSLSDTEILDFLDNYMLNLEYSSVSFDATIVEREKQGLIEKIQEEKDNKRKYSLEQLNKMMFEGEAYAISTLGEPTIIQTQTAESLKEQFKQILKNSKIIVNAVGNLKNNENIANKIYELIVNRLATENKLAINSSIDKYQVPEMIKQTQETQQIAQSVLAIGAKIVDVAKQDIYTLLVYNQILGGNPASLMFQNVRERNSLAYFAKSLYNRQRQTISVFAGIEPKNHDKAKALMLEQFNILKKGEFSDEQFQASYDTVIASLKEIYDNKEEISRMIFTNEMYFGEDITIDQMIENVKLVTKQDVIRVANKVYIDSIFCLGGKDHE